MSQGETDTKLMTHALALGRRGLGRVWPWPSVGCVLAKDGRVVGRGTSDKKSLRHGEVVALAQAGAAARGATAYVTLEPCSHHGRTPPCADALIDAGVARVVVALEDPNPLVNGGGIARLRAAGIEVETGLCAEEAAHDNAGFLSVIQKGRPFITLKLGASLDGRIATASGESKWITGPEARRAVHAMRARHDAVLVGSGTARADDPALTVRGMGKVDQPVRIVASRDLNLPRDGYLATTAHDVPLWLLHAGRAQTKPWNALGAVTEEVGLGDDGQLSAQAMLQRLGAKGISRVFCEGGGTLAASLLSAGLVDELIVFHAGLALGGQGTPGIANLGFDALGDAPRFDLGEVRRVGADIMSIWTPRPG